VIVLNLSCENQHLFEGWFASGDAFEQQQQQGLVACPVCGSAHIERRPNAPYVNIHSGQKPGNDKLAAAPPGRASVADSPAMDAAAMTALVTLLRQLGRESEDVGEEFVAEARRIHQGESETRNIRGQASNDEVDELLDEGILVLPLPPDESDLH